jgi:hypothetical protein
MKTAARFEQFPPYTPTKPSEVLVRHYNTAIQSLNF